MKRALSLTLTALVAVSCQDNSGPSPRELASPLLQQQPTQPTAGEDTYLNNTSKNENFGLDTVLSLVESAKNRVLIRFDDATVAEARAFAAQSADHHVFLTLWIQDNSGEWGPGRDLEVRVMNQDWDELGATWNCAIDADANNNQPNCDDDAWDVSKSSADPPWEATPVASALITTGQGGMLEFDVTAHVKHGVTPLPAGLVLMREDEQEAGEVALYSFDIADSERWPALEFRVCPPGATCGETLVPLTGGTNPLDFTVEVTGSPIIAVLDVDANEVILSYPGGEPVPVGSFPEELIFSLERVVEGGQDAKCLGLTNPSLEVGPCWEAKATDPATGNLFEIEFHNNQLLAACLPAVAGGAWTEAASDLYRLGRRATRLDDTARVEVMEPAPGQGILNCSGIFQAAASSGSSPFTRFARAIWTQVRQRLSPRPLYATAAAVGHHTGSTSLIPGLSFYSWTKLQVSHRADGWAYATVGRSCETCTYDKEPRKWYEEGFPDAANWASGTAAFGSADPVQLPARCDLDYTVATNWPSADPNFNPPARTELLLRREFFLLPETGSHDGSIDLEIRAAVHNDIQVYLNGVNVTEHAVLPEGLNLKKSKGWITFEHEPDGCPGYDEVIIRIPESLGLMRLNSDNLLAVHARSRDTFPSFVDVQVNVVHVPDET
jgi:hypothetical protein